MIETSTTRKVAVVTGASAGIGRAIALALGSRGLSVVAMARRKPRLEAVAQEIVQLGGESHALEVDLRDESQIVDAFDWVQAHLGRIDFLVNAAGLGRLCPLIAPDSSAMNEMWAVNVHGLCIATRQALRFMRPANRGHILHVSSLSAYRVQCGSGFYAATKHAVRALTEGLRRELRAEGSRVKVSSISPGDTQSEFLEAMYGSATAAAGHLPSYVPMRSEDVAQTAVHILMAPHNVEIHDVLMRPVDQPD